MINVSDKSCGEHQNRHLMFNNTFPKIMPFIRHCGKKWYSQTGHWWPYGTCALHAGWLRPQKHTHNM